jgi:hypothetical protein
MSNPLSVADVLATIESERKPATLIRLDIGHMLTHEPPPVEWLIDHIAARGHLTLLAGREKQGKSLLALGLVAAAVSGGGKVAGIDCHPCRALVVDAENGEREIHRRVRKFGITPPSALSLSYRSSAGFDLRAGLDELTATLDETGAELLVLDSFRSLWTGDENDNSKAAATLDPLRRLAQDRNVAVILIHHVGKAGGGYRGATAIGASVEHLLSLERHESDPDPSRRLLTNRGGCRFDAEAPDRWLTIRADESLDFLAIDLADPHEQEDGGKASAGASVRAGIAELLEGEISSQPTTQADLARAVGRDPKDATVRRALKALEATGRASRTTEGLWVSGCQGVNPLGALTPDTPHAVGSAGPTTSGNPDVSPDDLDLDAELERVLAKFPDLAGPAVRSGCAG